MASTGSGEPSLPTDVLQEEGDELDQLFDGPDDPNFIEPAEIKVYYRKDDPAAFVSWKVHADNDRPNLGPLPRKIVPDDIDLSLSASPTALADAFFEKFFPSVSGHAERMDKYLSDARASWNTSVTQRKIKFHDASAKDPDWIVKRCYLVLIAAAGEVAVGVDGLFETKRIRGQRREPANFGKYIKRDYFEAFKSAAPFMWAPEKEWYKDRDELSWDIFKPALAAMTEQRQEMFGELLRLLLDESMSGWRPKTSKYGGLPNITWEPRKLVPLGTMLRNAVEAACGILVFQDVVESVEVMRSRKYFDVESSLPSRAKINASTSEVLRQVEGSFGDGLNNDKAKWVGGDAWFGGVMSCVELKRRFNVDSTFIVKNNTSLYPKEMLRKILCNRHSENPAGNWVVATCTISGVTMAAMVYACSKVNCSFFITTVGDTRPGAEPYVTCYEDDFGNVVSKEIPRPDIASFLYSYLPVIDEHNRQRQGILALEKCWPTKSCWFRLLTTLVGQCVVDFHRACKLKYPKRYDVVDIKQFSDMLSSSLEIARAPSAVPTPDSCSPLSSQANKRFELEAMGRKSVTQKGRQKGSSKQQACYVCRKYYTSYKYTSWLCPNCNTPICKKDRTAEDPRRPTSCFEEHMNSVDGDVMCTPGIAKGQFPASKKLRWT